jgi:hypothetical protein
MGRIFPQLIRLFLAATLVVGGIFVHADAAAHAASSDLGVPHSHSTHAETSDATDFGTPHNTDPSHALGFCVDAHCCAPAVHMSAQCALWQSLESGKLAIGTSPDYALSVADSLLRPPRAIA